MSEHQPDKHRLGKRVAIHVLITVVALLAVSFFFYRKTHAQPRPKAPVASAGPTKPAGSAPPADGDDNSKNQDKKGDKGEKGDKGDKGDKDKKERLPGDDALDEAVVGAKGGVPVQPKGPFRSPFAKPSTAESVPVEVGVLLQSVDSYDIKAGTFEASFYLSLTSENPMPDINLSFPNGKADEKEVIADRDTFKLYHYTGTFKSTPDLRNYPFDSQELKIEVEDRSKGVDQIRLRPNQQYTNTDVGFEVVGWDVTYLESRSLAGNMPKRFQNDDLYYGRYILRLGLKRFSTNAIFTVYLPAYVIVLIGLLGMWIPPEEMEVRSNAGAPMLAAAVLFHFSLMQNLPATSYLTPADKLMVGVYVSLVLAMMSTWAFFLFHEKHWDKVFKVARIFVPIATVVVMGATLYF